MTVKELHDALSMAYWKGIQDFQAQVRKIPGLADIPPASVTETKELNEELNKSAEGYIDKLLVQVLSGIKVSVK